MKILLVEDDLSTLSFIKKGLKEFGHIVDAFSNGNEGLDAAYLAEHDVIILDRMLPEIDGLTIVTKLRNNKITTPVLFLSALGEVDDKVKGLKAGGDDYLTKPFSFSELIARIEALNRRQNPKSDIDVLKAYDLVLNKKSRKVTRNSILINLQPQEYKLLEVLMENSNEVITRTMLLEKVWDLHFDPQTNIIDVHISRLRKKIDKGHKVQLVQTIRGAGYSIQYNKT
ncbi:MAG: DNA-binding response regulator [Alphaproteobacteria bacterium]|nr:DNA-binding response regulator [Pelagibacterales bacterium]MAW58889.1 DNA-binding response regulator [Alphaproteobacteria bacterium]OUV28071.1 MAG: DNA-binding response regulator [Alphaproteobacteria bacterium TMED109]RCL83170.1 MAG: DNA-binding response regulator [Alphaproteobacteria bacterium]|tara:strand:- start:1184 stop:1864 length:681 start_codon:yes stop_codon:yes gene_type:complete